VHIQNSRRARKPGANTAEQIIGELRAVLRPPVTAAGQYVQRRYAVRSEFADAVALFAGLGDQGARQ
jgi:hypothetical protein